MGKFLFDLVSCQSSGTVKNHGGKEYAEAVFIEIMHRGINVSGIYNSKETINPDFLEYCRKHGELIDISKITLQRVIDTGKFDVFYSPLPYSYYNIIFGDVKFLGNIHGLRALEAYSDKYEFKYAFGLVEKVKAIVKRIPFAKPVIIKRYKRHIGRILNNPSFICITGSEHSRYFIITHFPRINENRIHVFYDPLIIEEPKNSGNPIGEKYYLLVSGNRWEKNTFRGILALDKLISLGLLKTKVVVTGCSNHNIILNGVKNKDSFIIKGYVSIEELASLYSNAYCLLFLSLSEGFGYPPLEAISRSVPVVCSPLTAIYEIYQNGVLYCDPLSVEDIETKILMMENKQIYANYKQQGVIRAKEIIKLQKEDLVKLVDFIISFVNI